MFVRVKRRRAASRGCADQEGKVTEDGRVGIAHKT
jgi:hypothetical protein